METAEAEYNESMECYREQLEIDQIELQTLEEQCVNEVKQNLDDIVSPTWSQKMTIVDWTPKIVFGGCHVGNVLDGSESIWNTHPANRCENYTWQISFQFDEGLTLID